MLNVKFKKHEPSGNTACSSASGAGKTKVFHALNVASYDPEYFDNFGVFTENSVSCVKQTGAKVILIPPFLDSLMHAAHNLDIFAPISILTFSTPRL